MAKKRVEKRYTPRRHHYYIVELCSVWFLLANEIKEKRSKMKHITLSIRTHVNWPTDRNEQYKNETVHNTCVDTHMRQMQKNAGLGERISYHNDFLLWCICRTKWAKNGFLKEFLRGGRGWTEWRFSFQFLIQHQIIRRSSPFQEN